MGIVCGSRRFVRNGRIVGSRACVFPGRIRHRSFRGARAPGGGDK